MVKKKTCVPLFDSGYSKEFSCSVNLCHFDSTLVLFLFPIFPPPTTFSSYQSATEVEKSIMERICELFLAKYMCLQIFIKLKGASYHFLPPVVENKQTDEILPSFA